MIFWNRRLEAQIWAKVGQNPSPPFRAFLKKLGSPWIWLGVREQLLILRKGMMCPLGSQGKPRELLRMK